MVQNVGVERVASDKGRHNGWAPEGVDSMEENDRYSGWVLLRVTWEEVVR